VIFSASCVVQTATGGHYVFWKCNDS